mmetsp:Transcript_23827/g.48178  ORF Transcript_23827/g.48178 Transcript_23827/m.48178 type:complete len:141 (-) Transcript_23827:1692-2114(-)
MNIAQKMTYLAAASNEIVIERTVIVFSAWKTSDWQNFRREQRRRQIEVERAFVFEDNADRHGGGADNPVRERDFERDLERDAVRDNYGDVDRDVGRNVGRDNDKDIERYNQQQLQKPHRPDHQHQPNRIDIDGDRLIFEH